MKKLIVGLMVVGLVGMMGLPVMAATTDSANVSLIVTPVVKVDLNVSPTYYNFGFVDVLTSTASITSLTLTNAGDVGINIDKTVWDDAEWRIDYSSTTQDGFGLWAMTDDNQPGQSNYTTVNGHEFDNEIGTFSNLTELGGGDESMDPSDTESIWFRLDMPDNVGNTNQQTIHIRLRGYQQ